MQLNTYDLAYHEWVRSFEIDRERYPYYDLVPKDLIENLSFRRELQVAALEDLELQQQLWQMCRRDTLFWINCFCWLFEPRPRPKTIPFITWPNQDPCICTLEECLGVEDAGVEKSRGEGASWLTLMILLKYWIFGDPLDDDFRQFAFGLVSRTEEAVDDPDDPDSLMWKLDFQIKKLPIWMRPKYERKIQRHLLRNMETDSTIVGYSAVGDVASGGRKTAFMMDEMAKFKTGHDYAAMSSTQYVTDCRFVVSTFRGNSGYYYDALRGPDSSMRKIILDWKDNPTRNRGLYTVSHGRVKPLDGDANPLPEDYQKTARATLEILRNRGFQIEDKIRSPWYDAQCARTGATPSSIAEELDRDPERSGSPFFDPEVLQRVIGNTRPPHEIGKLDYYKETYEPHEWVQNPRGEWNLWCEILATGRPSNAYDYVMGIDVAAGGGGSLSSNSCISVANVTGQKVAEFASPRVLPQDLARLAHAAGHWFTGPAGPAYLIFESNGPTGAQFARAIMELEYERLYFDESETEISRKKRLRPGFHNQSEKRGILYGGYRQALSDGYFMNPSSTALNECKFYEHQPGGGIEHVSAKGNKEDAAGAGHNHGDRATADALCWRGIIDIAPHGKGRNPTIQNEPTIQTKNAPMGSFLARRNEWRKREESEAFW
jgi:hypothetical protein